MISVCIATYNGCLYIKDQLISILSQISENDEIIVSDDGSKDNTIEVVKSLNDDRIKICYNCGVHSYTSNFENALRHAQGDIIMLSDQDDIWCDDKVAIVCKDLETYDFVTSDASVVDQDLNIIYDSFWKLRKPGFSPWRDFLRCGYLGCCMSFNRKVLKKALPFPPNRNLCVHDYWLQMVGSFFFKVKYETKPLILYRRHASNVSDAGIEGKGGSIYMKIKYRLYTLWYLLKRRI